jgi:hypothetical protein
VNTFNVLPRPRVLFEDVPDDLLNDLVRLVPTSKVVHHDEKVHESEYDILVTFAKNVGVRSKHLHVLSFGASSGDSYWQESGRLAFHRSHQTQANELTIPAPVPSSITSLLKSSVVPNIQEGLKETWCLHREGTYGKDDTGNLNDSCTPLMHVGAEKYVYAFLRSRGEKDSTSPLMLVLPYETQQHLEWQRLFLDLVGQADPVVVPPEVEWKTSERWAPPEVSKIVKDLESLRDEYEKTVAELEARKQALTAQLGEAARRADAGPAKLLTADGDDLTAAVLTALQDLGFGVRDMDDHHDKKTGAKLEDLRVVDPSKPDWLCLAEVKGYTKGAKVNDVPQITGRPSVAYTKETGEEPSAVWHIVNAWRRIAPVARVIAIPNDDDLRPLTDAGGALIDTRDLFEAWRDVQAGKAEAQTVRASLQAAMTRWTYCQPDARVVD